MIRTMRITVIFAALVLWAVTPCLAADNNLEDLLKKPGIAEQMQANYGGKTTSAAEQDTPLVKQAKTFALRINPPPPPEPVKKEPAATTAAPRPKAEITAKFKLIGTSYHLEDDTESWALIDEVGKGLHWVKQGGKVGYLLIEKVGDGSVLINDNGNKYELKAERQNKPDLVKSYTGTASEDKPVIIFDMTTEMTSPISPAAPVVNTENAVPSEPVVQLSPEETLRQAQENIEWLKKLQQESGSAGMTNEEANQLGNLGELLQSLENEAERAAAEANSPEPVEVEEDKREDVNQTEPKQAPAPPPQGKAEPTRLKRIRERR